MISAILPKGVGHIHPVLSTTFRNHQETVGFQALSQSILCDFYLKTTGRSDVYESTLRQFPLIERSSPLFVRTLTLNCLTTHYADLWEESWSSEYRDECWTRSDPRLDANRFHNLTPTWQRHCALRTDFERRQALVEIDVLAAMALGLALEELQTIYRVQFPVLRHYDRHTYYDQTGRIVYTKSRGLTGVGFKTAEWKKIKDKKSGTVEKTIQDDTLPGGPVERTIAYHAPFTGVDRETDYEVAWKVFEERLGDSSELGSNAMPSAPGVTRE